MPLEAGEMLELGRDSSRAAEGFAGGQLERALAVLDTEEGNPLPLPLGKFLIFQHPGSLLRKYLQINDLCARSTACVGQVAKLPTQAEGRLEWAGLAVQAHAASRQFPPALEKAARAAFLYPLFLFYQAGWFHYANFWEKLSLIKSAT